MTHPWKSMGEKRTIWWYHAPSNNLMKYLGDMRDATHHGVLKAEELRRKTGKIPSPIELRREMKSWFDSSYTYAKHHINPVCRSSVAILRSFMKNSKGKRFPEVRKLAVRLDGELVRMKDGMLRITIRPGEYEYIPINTKNKKFQEYSHGKLSEALITDKIISLSFTIQGEKETSASRVGVDVNFSNITATVIENNVPRVIERDTRNIVNIQNDFARRRMKLQKHIVNRGKRLRKLKETRGRQKNRIKDAMHRLSSSMVKEHRDATFVLEDLRNIRKNATGSKKLRTHLNRWPYAEFQRMMEYKSRWKTIYVNPRGTSSECPVCGGKLKHPAWKISRCDNCGRDYDRDRLASLAISLRGLDLCGDPFPVSAMASLPSVMHEYLYVRNQPGTPESGRTETAYASNEYVHRNA